MCDSELVRDLRKEEIEAYLAKARLANERISKALAPVAAMSRRVLQTLRGASPEGFMSPAEKEIK